MDANKMRRMKKFAVGIVIYSHVENAFHFSSDAQVDFTCCWEFMVPGVLLSDSTYHVTTSELWMQKSKQKIKNKQRVYDTSIKTGYFRQQEMQRLAESHFNQRKHEKIISILLRTRKNKIVINLKQSYVQILIHV